METTLYDELIKEMRNRGLSNKYSMLEEKDVTISDDDESIYITVNECKMISIKGIRESRIKRRLSTSPHYIYLKIYDYDYKEAEPEDSVQFSITEFGKKLFSEDRHIIYYHYPYKMVSAKLVIKKGIVITKDKRLEIRIVRKNIPLKIGKFELKIECDKWY
jgi:hypothetical protein